VGVSYSLGHATAGACAPRSAAAPASSSLGLRVFRRVWDDPTDGTSMGVYVIQRRLSRLDLDDVGRFTRQE
jgi:hypothetical protein